MYILFSTKPNEEMDHSRSIDDRYQCELWRPSIRAVVPPGLTMIPFAAWWLFHYFRIFANRDYCLLLVYDGETLIHRSCVLPTHFRFPFMAKDDLQISSTWTDKKYRGNGISPFAIQEITRLLTFPGRNFWYITREKNKPSIRSIEKAGFSMVGKVKRTKRFGFRSLGAFVPE